MTTDNMPQQIMDRLRSSAPSYFPEHQDLQSVRVIGHTPKPDHYLYEVALEFADDSERVSVKLFRPSKRALHEAQDAARRETRNLEFVHHAFQRGRRSDIPRPLGDFSDLGAVVSSKVNGAPLQSMLVKEALLPEYGNAVLLRNSAAEAGEWLWQFHRATAAMPTTLDTHRFLAEMKKLCERAQGEGLPQESIDAILDNTAGTMRELSGALPSSAVLNNFVPLNVLVAETGIGFCEFAELEERGHSLNDAAKFLAGVEALEKYPFCNRSITGMVQDAFMEAYGVDPEQQALLTILKVKVLLQIFAQGRTVKESAVRKKVMWNNVMKRFVQQAAQRAMAPAA